MAVEARRHGGVEPVGRSSVHHFLAGRRGIVRCGNRIDLVPQLAGQRALAGLRLAVLLLALRLGGLRRLGGLGGLLGLRVDGLGRVGSVGGSRCELGHEYVLLKGWLHS